MLRGRHDLIFWFGSSALALVTGGESLASQFAPATMPEAMLGAAGFAGIFSLGATGLAMLDGRPANLNAGAVAALVLCGVSLASPGDSIIAVLQRGLVDYLCAAGLLCWAIWKGPGPNHRG